MNKIHFVHTTDWHLGFKQYNLEERMTDFFNAAEKVVAKIIDIKPQFVLHTGDLFHHQNPSAVAIRQAVKLFKKLKIANIPVYMVRGNHDARISRHLRSGGNIITLLDDLDLIVNGTDLISNPVDKCRIYGVGYYTGKSAVGRLEELLIQDEPKESYFDIIAMHAFVEGQVQVPYQVSLKDLSTQNVNYIGMGHYHIPWNNPKKGIYAPGSTETTSVKDWVGIEADPSISRYSKILEVTSEFENRSWNEPLVKEHEISVRPKIKVIHESTVDSLSELNKELNDEIGTKLEILKSFGDGKLSPLVDLTINSTIHSEQLNQLKISSLVEDLGLLYIIPTLYGGKSEFEVDLSSFKNPKIEEIVQEILGDDPEIETYLSLINDLIEKFGNAPLKNPTRQTVTEVIIALGEGNLSNEEIIDIVSDELEGDDE